MLLLKSGINVNILPVCSDDHRQLNFQAHNDHSAVSMSHAPPPSELALVSITLHDSYGRGVPALSWEDGCALFCVEGGRPDAGICLCSKCSCGQGTAYGMRISSLWS